MANGVQAMLTSLIIRERQIKAQGDTTTHPVGEDEKWCRVENGSSRNQTLNCCLIPQSHFWVLAPQH